MQNSKKTFFVIFYSFLATTIFWFYFDGVQLKIKSFATITYKAEKRSCGRFPSEEDLTIDNTVWQVLEIPKGFVKILNAYLDMRQNKSVVRLNVASPELNKSDVFHCQFWFDDVTEPTVVKATDVLLMWIFDGFGPVTRYPYLIECPFEGTIPASVSLVAKRCDYAENNLKVLNAQPADGVKKRFGVCTKQVYFDNRDFGMKLIEWICMVRLLGAEKIHFHYTFLHPDLFEIVKYFEEQGVVEALPYFRMSGEWQQSLTEVNVLTDCYYRVKNLYDYVAILDFDEVIMPVNESDFTWEDIITRVNSSEYRDAYVSQNVYYPEVGAEPLEEVPKNMYMLQHIQRSQNFPGFGFAIKSIVGTERALTMHNHVPRHCWIDSKITRCNTIPVSKNISQNSHYRREMEAGKFNVTIVDKTIWKFKDLLIKAVQKAVKATKFRI